jgi:hypothetical protein
MAPSMYNKEGELINLITNQWDEELVRGVFHEDDVAQ